MNVINKKLGGWLASYLTKRITDYRPFSVHDVSSLASTLEPGDVLLVEGDTRVSSAIKYLTQSTWSHSAIYVGPEANAKDDTGRVCELVEADIKLGVIAVPLEKYETYNTRICRPVGLSTKDQQAIVDYVVNSLGNAYDLKNIVDLARYLLPTPPVPVRFRRRMIAMGSGDPTRAICSTLIAQAFQSVQYPILPKIESKADDGVDANGYTRQEIYHIRHHSLFAPRDFDISPYFQIVKPTVERGFNYLALEWAKSE